MSRTVVSVLIAMIEIKTHCRKSNESANVSVDIFRRCYWTKSNSVSFPCVKMKLRGSIEMRLSLFHCQHVRGCNCSRREDSYARNQDSDNEQ